VCEFSDATLVLILDAMCFSRLVFIVGNVPLISLWSATLFRDNQTAVDAGNGTLRENFMVSAKKFSLLRQVRRAQASKRPRNGIFRA
jgi:hypothetical protein